MLLQGEVHCLLELACFLPITTLNELADISTFHHSRAGHTKTFSQPCCAPAMLAPSVCSHAWHKSKTAALIYMKFYT
jgi:hypothetical protein